MIQHRHQDVEKPVKLSSVVRQEALFQREQWISYAS